MDFDHDDDLPIHPWDIVTLAACAPLRGRPGFHVAPQISTQVLTGALRSYLRLEPGELLLAVIDTSAGQHPDTGCVLTTQRVCWSARPPASAPGRLDEGLDDPPMKAGSDRSVSYESLPDPVGLTGMLDPALDLGDGRRLALVGLDRPVLGTLAAVLTTIRRAQRSGDYAGSSPANDIRQARSLMPMVLRQNAALQQVPGDVLAFHAALMSATSSVVVTRSLMIACVLIFVAMTVSGVSPLAPTADSLLGWGANLGLALATEGQTWRLLTAVFLHGGLIHLAINMWCLSRIGPLVERLFGHVGFGLLYLGAGLGGFLASAWAHPLSVSVGASGAIFGVIGGLLAFLLIHRNAIPMSVLEPMRGGVFSFILYNSLFGMMIPGIDNAAHFGGLGTGFVAGILLSRPWPIRSRQQGLARQLLGGIALAAILAGLGIVVVDHVRRNPEVLQVEHQNDFNALMERLNPVLRGFNRVSTGLDDLLTRLESEPAPVPEHSDRADDPRQTLDRLTADLRQGQVRLRQIGSDDPDLTALVGHLGKAQDAILRAMEALRRFLDHPEDGSALQGPDGFLEHRRQSNAQVKQFVDRRQAYFAKHDLVERNNADPRLPGG